MFQVDEFCPIPTPARGAMLAIGNFDGVHRGHARLIQRLRALADAHDVLAIPLFFDPRPVDLLRPDLAPAPLTWPERKAHLLIAAGAHDVGAFATGPWLLGLTARQFFDQILLDRFQARGLVEGPTFGFGRDRGGDSTLLQQWCSEAGLLFEVVDPIEVDSSIVSSTRIRRAILGGHVEEASRCLGRPHRIRGTVVPGAGRGAPLGFPTANLSDIRVLTPEHGVYACWARLDDASPPHPAAVHIGPNATFNVATPTVEAHLLDFSADIYGRSLSLDLVARIRPTRKFNGVAELIAQIADDLKRTRRLLDAETSPQ